MILDIHPEAHQDAQDAYDFYFAREPDAATNFVLRLEAVLKAILERPARFPRYKLGTRRALLRRYPHQVIYQLDAEAQTVRVLAVVHLKKRPDSWTARL